MVRSESFARHLLVAEGATKSFGRLRAVDDLTFAVAQGEILGIAGPNGAGKSTLFNILSGAPYPADAGRISFAGQRIENASPRAICRAGLVRTFQTETVFDTLSVWENVQIAGRYGGRYSGRADLHQGVASVLELVGLAAVAHATAANLALAAKKRLMIASAVVCKPRLLLLDEPASGLNDGEQAEFVELAREIHNAGVTLVIIEHVLPLLMRLADRLLIMAAGKPLAEGPPATILHDERVVEAYVGKHWSL
jgi:branched-chain amino acid transport system ATP-binding protein